jgi:hypothetical protein
MKISHHGRSEAVNRALSDFGIEDSFATAAIRFKEHYHYHIGPSATTRATKNTAQQALEYIETRLSNPGLEQEKKQVSIDTMLVELDGCEIRTAQMVLAENSTKTTPVYENPKKNKQINWRDVRIGFVRALDSNLKTFVGRMDSYPEVIGQLHSAALLAGMSSRTDIVGVADGGIGLSEELKRQFPTMQFILDKSHLKDHFYDTAEKIGIDKKERVRWVKSRVKAISNGDVEEIVQELKDEYEKDPNNRLKRLIGYLERFYDALNYDSFKEKKLFNRFRRDRKCT